MGDDYTGVIDWEHYIPPIQETKMFKNRFLFVLGVISLLSVTMAVSYPRSTASQAASDFHQRHPNWTWTVNSQNAVIPVTGDSAFPDYAQRHPELSVSPIIGLGASDYFQRHSELITPSILGLGASDYFMRHPELTVPADASVDMTDYYFRHPASLLSPMNTDLTDYFFRHR
jgi:hypothetical protein